MSSGMVIDIRKVMSNDAEFGVSCQFVRFMVLISCDFFSTHNRLIS